MIGRIVECHLRGKRPMAFCFGARLGRSKYVMNTWYAEAGKSRRFPPQYGDKGEDGWSGKGWIKDRERALVERAIRRDTAAFTQLYDAFVDGIFRYAFYKTGHRTEAEDITAQVFLKA